MRLMCPVTANAPVHHDSMQPRRWRGFVSESVAVNKSAHERILDDVFRVLARVPRRNREQMLTRLFIYPGQCGCVHGGRLYFWTM
jgi:hypothetical protein